MLIQFPNPIVSEDANSNTSQNLVMHDESHRIQAIQILVTMYKKERYVLTHALESFCSHYS